MAKIKNQVYIKSSVPEQPPVLRTLTDNYNINDVATVDDPLNLELLHPIHPGDNITAEGIFKILKDLIYNDEIFANASDAASESFSEGVFDLSRSTLSAAQEDELKALIRDRDEGDGITWIHVDNNNTPYTIEEQAIAVARLEYLLIRKYYCSFAISAEEISVYAGFFGRFDLPNLPPVSARYIGHGIPGDIITSTPLTIEADGTDVNSIGILGNLNIVGDGVTSIAGFLGFASPKMYKIYQTYIGIPAGCTTSVTIIRRVDGLGTTDITFNGTDTIAEAVSSVDYILFGNTSQVPDAVTITLTADTAQIPLLNDDISIANGTDEVEVLSTPIIITAINPGASFNKTITGDGVQTLDQLVNHLLYAKYYGKPLGFTSDVLIVEDDQSGADLIIEGDGITSLADLLAATGRNFTVYGDASQIISLTTPTPTSITIAMSPVPYYTFDVNNDPDQILKLDSHIVLSGGKDADPFYAGADVVAKIQVGPGKIKIYEEDDKKDSVYYVRNEGEADPEDPIGHPADGVFYVKRIGIDTYYRRDLISVVFRDTENLENRSLPYLKYEYGNPSNEITPRHNVAYNKVLTPTYGSYPLWSMLYKRTPNKTWLLKTDQIFAWTGLLSVVSFENVIPYRRINKTLAIHTWKDIPLRNLNGESLAIDYGESSYAKFDQLDGDSYELDEAHHKLLSIPTELDSIAEDDSTTFTFPFMINELYNDYLTYNSIELRNLNILTEQFSDYIGTEGIEANFFTAPKFTNEQHNSEIEIDTVELISGKHKVIVADQLNEYVFKTLDGIEYINTRMPAAGDIVFISAGIGQGQIATIASVNVVNEYTEIFLTNMFLSPVPAIGSKLIVFKAEEEVQVGFELTDHFLSNLDPIEAADYNTQYYPADVALPIRHSGTSRLPWTGGTWTHQLRDQLLYADANPLTHKFYSDTAAMITFPFKLRINLNQYYFVKICVARKLGIGAPFDVTIKSAVTDVLNITTTEKLPWFSSIYNKNAGMYPGVTDDGKVFFKIYHQVNDIEDRTPVVMTQRTNTESAPGSGVFLPPYWKPVAKNLDSILSEEELSPPARPLDPNYDPITSNRIYDITAPGIVYVDTQSGKIMFHPDDEPIKSDINITFTADNVITGRADTESILHILNPESPNRRTVTLRSVLENLTLVSGESGEGGGSTTKTVQMVNHGFFTGQVLYFDDNYKRADASSTLSLGLFIVANVLNSNSFVLMQTGYFKVPDGKNLLMALENGDPTFIPNTWYYLSDTAEGKLTSVSPVISNPILYAISPKEAYVVGYRPHNIAIYKTFEFPYVVGTTEYMLPYRSESKETISVAVSGVLQYDADYDIDGKKLTLHTVYADGAEVRVEYITTPNYYPGAAIEEYKELTVADTTTFTLENAPISSRHLTVTVNGQGFDSDDYIISGNNVITNDTIPAGQKVRIINIYASRLLGFDPENTPLNSIPGDRIIDNSIEEIKIVNGIINQIADTQTVILETDSIKLQESAGSVKKTTFAYIKTWILTWIYSYIYPVGSFYVQYPDAASNDDATAFPTSSRPATMFGGTWVEQFNTEGIVFQTAGYDGAVGRVNGLHEDSFQGHRFLQGLSDNPNTPGRYGIVNTGIWGGMGDAYDSAYVSRTGAYKTSLPYTDDTNGTPRTGTRTVHRNRLAKYWKRTVL